MSESRDERELTTDLELRTPMWLPGGRLALHYRRLWDKRADNLVDQVARVANVHKQTLLERIGEGGGFADIFQCAGRRMIEDGDPGLHDIYTRLIAAALNDNARIHEVSYLLGKLEYLQPLHIRIIATLPSYREEASTWRTVQLAEKVNASLLLVRSAVRELRNYGFIVEAESAHHLAQDRDLRLDDLGVALGDLIGKFRQ